MSSANIKRVKINFTNISAAILAIGLGFQNGWPQPSVPKLLSHDLGFEVTEDQVSYIVMIAPLGYLIGSPLTGYLLDRIGRKYTLLLLAVPQILAWLMIAMSNGVCLLYLARLIAGVSDGALYTALPVYMGEVSEPNIRGVLGISHSLGILIGMLLMNAYGSFITIRTAAYISLSAPLIFLVIFMWMPESPYYFIMKQRTEDARKSLQRLRRMHDVDNEMTNITLDVKRQISEPGSYRDIFTIKSNLKAFFMLLGLRTFQQFSGVTAIGFYVQVIFAQSEGGLSPADSAIICSAVQLLFACFGSLIVDRFGRKPLFIASGIGSSAILIVLGLYFTLQQQNYDVSSFTWVPVTGIVLFKGVCTIGLLIIPCLMASELLSVSIKSKALGIVHMYLGLSISVASKMFHWMDQDFGMSVPFFVFSVFSAVGAVFCYFGVPETKGKTLEEIQQILKGNVDTKLRETEDTQKDNNIIRY